jgi:hypothetical protein
MRGVAIEQEVGTIKAQQYAKAWHGGKVLQVWLYTVSVVQSFRPSIVTMRFA